ncbi:hypothetical protein QT381_08715, partial [Galbitalea sp. SE-J8]|nr:hypothetical protein [Galbitalea sp. SE-J8]
MTPNLVIPDPARLVSMSDDEVLDAQARLVAVRREIDRGLALVAAEVARRSDRERGHAGLAQRMGERTADRLVQRTAGVSAADARALVGAGAILTGASPWLAPVAAAVAEGTVGVAAAAAIGSGLGAPSSSVAADDLTDAAARLVVIAA